MREAPELAIEISDRTALALDREAEWPDTEVQRRFVEAGRRRRLAARLDLLDRIDEVLKVIA